MKTHSNNSVYWIAGMVILIGTVGFAVWYKQRQKKKRAKSEETTAYTPASTSSSPVHAPVASATAPNPFRCINRDYPLYPGTCHPDVKILQKFLRHFKEDIGTSGPGRDGVDGKFGMLTAKAAQSRIGKTRFNQTDIAGMKMTLKLNAKA